MQKVDVLRAACCVAGTDGRPNEAELLVIKRLAAEVGVGKASMEAMIDRGATDAAFHEEQFRVLKADPQESLAALLEVASADGSISDDEVRVLRALSEKLNIDPDLFEQLLNKVNEML